MHARPITKADYDRIVAVIDQWWEGPTTALAHPIFFYELGRLAQVVEWDDGAMVGFLLGFVVDPHVLGLHGVSLTGPPSSRGGGARIGYIHLVGIDPDYRRRGVARALYAAFEEACTDARCVAIKAIAPHGNEGSVRFHTALGFTASNVDDYAGPGRSRMVFLKQLGER
ncbi:MAG: GNAT family N-acetyltransferase [Polyangiaceae bacterium]